MNPNKPHSSPETQRYGGAKFSVQNVCGKFKNVRHSGLKLNGSQDFFINQRECLCSCVRSRCHPADSLMVR